jgi:hypothetical protein
MEAPMRIIFFLAAAAGAAAASGPAPAQTSSMGPRSGHPHASAANGSAGWILRSNPDFRRGRPGCDHDRRHDRFGRGGEGLLYSYGFDGAPDRVDPHGNGFFAGGGGGVVMRAGRPLYDYDRSYPYEWAPSAAGPGAGIASEGEDRSEPFCSLERGVRVCRARR